MMAIGIAAFITGMYPLAILCLPLLLMSMLGISFNGTKNKEIIVNEVVSTSTVNMSKHAA